MKKVFLSLSLVTFLGIAMTSCLKNDNTPTPQPVDPSLERAAINAFNDSMGFHMTEITDSASFYAYDKTQNIGVLKNAYVPYIQYEIVEQGDKTADTTSVPDTELGGSKTGNTVVYSSLSDSTLLFSCTYTGTLLNGDKFDGTDEGKAMLNALPNLLPAWQVLIGKIGKGGHIRFVTPSIYGYGTQAQENIPANSPLFFDVYVKGFIKNDYSN